MQLVMRNYHRIFFRSLIKKETLIKFTRIFGKYFLPNYVPGGIDKPRSSFH